ncbi:MAG TPA: fasciclin domain-containing protein [Flavobacterium sp.]|nr:fasciclin domain-containing protein [Flavobacterium sp.]HQW69214.1 fasciclin domain-containing protein [Flavobacterium sp.]
MKNLFKNIALIAVSIFVLSCSDDDNNSNEPQTIADIASANPNLSILVQALDRAGLVATFDGTGDFTVFAPTNTAFNNFLATTPYATINDVPVPVLTEILKNHVIGASYTSSELTTGYVKTLAKGSASSTNTLSMYIDLTSGVKINGGSTNGGANVVLTSANIAASNGVIHVVDNVIGLPTVVNHAIANPSFATLTTLLSAQGLVPTLSGTASSPFTVFAPVESAFNSATLSLYGSLSSDLKTQVLTYHVVGGANVLANAIPSGNITTLQGQGFTISGTAINDAGTDVNKNIILTDVQCSNGVVHAIDNVLIPNFN